jgi:hypothetical protein
MDKCLLEISIRGDKVHNERIHERIHERIKLVDLLGLLMINKENLNLDKFDSLLY